VFTHANSYRYSYANDCTHCYADSDPYRYRHTECYGNSYPYGHGQTNAYCAAERITEATSYTSAAANSALECHLEKPVESAQLLYETEVHSWIKLI
jgi:hypothetical protein